MELEYGVTGWWTAETYLQGQVTAHDSTIFTGFRFENRFRPLRRSHWINPVLYVEYEDVSTADKSFLEVTGNHVIQDQQVPNRYLRRDVERSVEGKLIASSYVKGFNVSENLIAEKNVSNEPWEFGYAVGVSRPLANEASARKCVFCRQYLAVGGELFGGLGTRYTFGTAGTSQYAGPTIAYSAPRNLTVLVGPEFGLNANSATVLWAAEGGVRDQPVSRSFPGGAMSVVLWRGRRVMGGVCAVLAAAAGLMGAANGAWLQLGVGEGPCAGESADEGRGLAAEGGGRGRPAVLQRVREVPWR